MRPDFLHAEANVTVAHSQLMKHKAKLIAALIIHKHKVSNRLDQVLQVQRDLIITQTRS